MGGCCCDFFPLRCRKAGTRYLYRQRCCRLLIRSSGINSGPSIVGLLFRIDLLLWSGVHKSVCGSVRVAKEGWEATNDRKTSSSGPRPESTWLERKKDRGTLVLGRHLPQSTPLSPMLAVLFQLVALGVCNLVCAPESEACIRSDMSRILH